MPSSVSLYGLAVLSLLASEAAGSLFGGVPAAQQHVLSGQLLTNDTSWHKYVRAPPSQTIAPRAVVQKSVRGDVSNKFGLVDGHKPTILTRRTMNDTAPSLIVDFGQNVAGRLNMVLNGSATPSTTALPGLRLAFSETLQYLQNSSDFTRSDNAYSDDSLNKIVSRGTDQIAVESGIHTWNNSLGCRYDGKVCSDGLHGFRYVQIWLEALSSDAPHTTSLGEVAISSITLTYSGFLGTPDTFAGWFECSDANFTQWWYDAVYTDDLCTDIFLANNTDPRDAASPSLQGKMVIHDGAKRDRDPYVADLTVSALTAYLSHNLSVAARNVLEDVADHQRSDGWIPPASIANYTLPLFDYPLHWVVASYDLLLFTGNQSYLEHYYPVLVNVLDGFYPSVTDPDTSLLDKGLNGTAGYGDYAFLPRNGTITYYNAMYVLALSRAADWADTLSHAVDAARWRDRSSAVAASLLVHNWDSSAGAFFDGGPCPGNSPDPLCPTHPQDGNSIAILAGVTSANGSDGTGLAESILAHLSSAAAQPYGNAFYDNDMLLTSSQQSDASSRLSARVYAFISFFEVAARLSSNRSATVASGFDQLRRTYGWMSAQDPGVTFWEGIGADGQPYEGGYTSMAHGWATGVAPLLTRFLLGAYPAAAGFAQWTCRPVSAGSGVSWARGVVPTPAGPLAVSWEETACGYCLNVSAPQGTRGKVSVPVPDASARVSVDGSVEYSAGASVGMLGAVYEDGYVTVQVSGGEHVFSVG